MSIEFGCPQCGKQYRVDSRYAGKRGNCKQCGSEFRVPGEAVATAAPASVPASQATSVRATASAVKQTSPAAAPRPVISAVPAGQIGCIACGAANPIGTAFCSSCGRALPDASPTGPRVISGVGTDLPMSAVGRTLVSENLNAELSKACWALLAVALVQATLGPVQLQQQLSAMQTAHPGMVYHYPPAVYLTLFAISAAFWILFAWALRNPLPAAIVGLVLYITLLAIDAVNDPMSLLKGWILKIILISVLGKAISAGAKYRKLSRGSLAVAT